MSSSREDLGKQKIPKKGSAGQTKGVKLPGAEQRAEIALARDKEQVSTVLW